MADTTDKIAEFVRQHPKATATTIAIMAGTTARKVREHPAFVARNADARVVKQSLTLGLPIEVGARLSGQAAVHRMSQQDYILKLLAALSEEPVVAANLLDESE